VTLKELKTLCEGDPVHFASDVDRPGARPGKVWMSDDRCVEIHWPDGTSTLIWFSHCADGRDARFAFLKSPSTQKRATA